MNLIGKGIILGGLINGVSRNTRIQNEVMTFFILGCKISIICMSIIMNNESFIK